MTRKKLIYLAEGILLTVALVSIPIVLAIGINNSRSNPECVKEGSRLELVDLIPQVMESVVHIKCPEWEGSGFVISPHVIMTARHVVDDINDFTITFNDGSEVHSDMALSSKDRDISFIWLKDGCLVRPLELTTDIELGEEIFVIGSSLGFQHFNNITSGIVSAVERALEDFGFPVYYGWKDIFQVDAATYGGNSGCPVFTMDGKVCGVLVGGYGDYENISYCVPVESFVEDIEVLHIVFSILDKYGLEESVVSDYYEDYYDAPY
jgi:S1-C subfamily serine protease